MFIIKSVFSLVNLPVWFAGPSHWTYKGRVRDFSSSTVSATMKEPLGHPPCSRGCSWNPGMSDKNENFYFVSLPDFCLKGSQRAVKSLFVFFFPNSDEQEKNSGKNSLSALGLLWIWFWVLIGYWPFPSQGGPCFPGCLALCPESLVGFLPARQHRLVGLCL